MAKVKTAISIDEDLFRAAEERAGKMGVTRSELFSRAVARIVRDEETREMLARLNESHADGLDEEEKSVLDHMLDGHMRLLDETGNEWNPGRK